MGAAGTQIPPPPESFACEPDNLEEIGGPEQINMEVGPAPVRASC